MFNITKYSQKNENVLQQINTWKYFLHEGCNFIS